MFYIIYRGNGINILKCAKCKSYALELEKKDGVSNEKYRGYEYRCLSCGSMGWFRLIRKNELEWFDSWENMQDRIEEITTAMCCLPL